MYIHLWPTIAPHPFAQIELKVRNLNTLSRQLIIASCVPSGWTVDLDDAGVFFLIEVFKVRSLFVDGTHT
jgi:hypothetical protein